MTTSGSPRAMLLKTPLSVAFYITLKCNLSCLHCAYNCSPYRDEVISLKKFKKIISKLNKAGVFELGLIGGEPLIHPSIKSFFKILQDYDFVWAISTNGLPLKSREILNTLIKYEPFSVHISLHGYPEDVHDFLAGNKVSKQIFSVLDELKSTEIKVVLNSVLHKRLCSKIIEFISFLKTRKLKTSISLLIPMGRALKNWKFIAPTQSELMFALKMLNLYKSQVLYEEDILNISEECRGGRTILVIDPRGYCYPCDQALGLDFFNIKSCNILLNNIDSIWRTFPFEQFRRASKTHKSCPALSLIHFNDLRHGFTTLFLKFYGFKLIEALPRLVTLLENYKLRIKLSPNTRIRKENDNVLMYNRKNRKIVLVTGDLYRVLMQLNESCDIGRAIRKYNLSEAEIEKLNNYLEELIKGEFLDVERIP